MDDHKTPFLGLLPELRLCDMDETIGMDALGRWSVEEMESDWRDWLGEDKGGQLGRAYAKKVGGWRFEEEEDEGVMEIVTEVAEAGKRWKGKGKAGTWGADEVEGAGERVAVAVAAESDPIVVE